MVKALRLFVEGGGDHRQEKAALSAGFKQFFKRLRELARQQHSELYVQFCGSRLSTYDDFCTALESYPDSFNILVVDAEEEVVRKNPWEHLRERRGDGWQRPDKATAQHCHLMVQTMEAWIVADVEMLQEYYGQRFQAKALPKHANLEKVSKQAIADALKRATAKTQKGEYHKTRHAPDLLAKLRLAVVCRRASYCQRLAATLAQQLGEDDVQKILAD